MTGKNTEALAKRLLDRLVGKSAHTGVIGMGYVGLPLAIAVHRAGFNVTGFDVDHAKVQLINGGGSPIHTQSGERIASMVNTGVSQNCRDGG